MKSFHTSTMIKSLILLLALATLGAAQNKDAEKIRFSERLMRAGQYETALSTLQTLYRRGNTTPKVINNINRCYQELKLEDERIAFLEDVIRKTPGVYAYRIALGKAWFQKQEKEKALRVWEQVLRQGPRDLMRYRLVAQAMYGVRLFDEAIAVYKKALKAFPEQSAFLMDIGNLYRAQLDYEQAARYYLAYLKKNPKQYNYIRSLMLNMARDREHTRRIIDVIRREAGNNAPRMRELLAYMYMRAGDFERAFEIVKRIGERDGKKADFSYLNRFIDEAERGKAWPYAIRGYELMLGSLSGVRAAAPTYHLARLHYNYGRTLRDSTAGEARKHIDKALDLLKKLVESNSHQKIRAAILAGDIHKDYFNDLDGALAWYTQFPINNTGSASEDALRLKLADVYLLKNDLKAAGTFYAAVNSERYKTLALWQQAEIGFYTGRFKKAGSLYRSLLGQTGLSDTLSNNILERLLLLNDMGGDSLSLSRYARAALLKRQKKESEAAKTFSSLARGKGPLSRQAALEAITLYTRLKKYGEAVRAANIWLENNAGDEKADEVFFLLGQLYRRQQQPGRALAVYEIIMQKYPYSFYSDEARQQAREISETINGKAEK